MPPKPRTAAGYQRAQVTHVHATCLYVATKLGDLADELVIVGGLVPSLIIDQRWHPPGMWVPRTLTWGLRSRSSTPNDTKR